jgi:chitin synthase
MELTGAQSALDPEPLAYLALGDGNRQHNVGRVYSGLYEHKGHVVPYIVRAAISLGKAADLDEGCRQGWQTDGAVKARQQGEARLASDAYALAKQGSLQRRNGASRARDLSSHQVRVISRSSSFHRLSSGTSSELIHRTTSFSSASMPIPVRRRRLETCGADCSSEVAPDSLSKMVAAMLRDRRVMALCGETSISNARKSLITSLQVRACCLRLTFAHLRSGLRKY